MGVGLGVFDRLDSVDGSASSRRARWSPETIDVLSEGSTIDDWAGEGAEKVGVGRSRWVDDETRMLAVAVEDRSVSLAWLVWIERVSKDIRRRSAFRQSSAPLLVVR